LSFSQPKFSRSKFDPSVEGWLTKASQLLTLDVCKRMKTKSDGIFSMDTGFSIHINMNKHGAPRARLTGAAGFDWRGGCEFGGRRICR
jgi:hypothetical protein